MAVGMAVVSSRQLEVAELYAHVPGLPLLKAENVTESTVRFSRLSSRGRRARREASRPLVRVRVFIICVRGQIIEFLLVQVGCRN
jgi:hypothetical protein